MVLFEKTDILGFAMANRFVRSATWEGMASETGACTPALVELMERLAGGDVGLIISGHAYVRDDGVATPRQLGVSMDAFVPGLRAMASAVHSRGGKIALQLAHGGLLASRRFTGTLPVGPSVTEEVSRSQRGVELTVEDIRDIVEAYGRAAGRAKEAGFDGVQIHAAHGYLLSQFLSPYFNRRRDAYGGSVRNRARLLLEILEAVRAEVGRAFPLLAKMNCRDFLEGGLDAEDALETALLLQAGGIDALELSGGTLLSGDLSPSRRGIATAADEAYFKSEAALFRQTLNIPLILVGGIRSLEVAGSLAEKGVADCIAMSRPFIREPGLVKRWLGGDSGPAACDSDNRCFKPAMVGPGVYCVTEKEGPRAKP